MLAKFVASYGQILLSPDLPEVERSSHLKHLVSWMYFSQLYDWQAVSSFHGTVLLGITEMGGFVSTFRKPYFLWSS